MHRLNIRDCVAGLLEGDERVFHELLRLLELVPHLEDEVCRTTVLLGLVEAAHFGDLVGESDDDAPLRAHDEAFHGREQARDPVPDLLRQLRFQGFREPRGPFVLLRLHRILCGVQEFYEGGRLDSEAGRNLEPLPARHETLRGGVEGHELLRLCLRPVREFEGFLELQALERPLRLQEDLEDLRDVHVALFRFRDERCGARDRVVRRAVEIEDPVRLLVCLLHEADCFEVVLDAQGGLRPLQDVPHLVDVDLEVLDLHDLLLHEVEQVLRRGNDVLPGALADADHVRVPPVVHGRVPVAQGRPERGGIRTEVLAELDGRAERLVELDRAILRPALDNPLGIVEERIRAFLVLRREGAFRLAD